MSAPEATLQSGAQTPAPVASQFDRIDFLGPAKEALVGDIRYSYHRFGKPEGGKPALIFIQGLGGVQLDWPMAMLEEIQKSREVILFDNALAGMSVDTKAGERQLRLTIPFMAESTVGLIQELKLGAKPDVLGLSMGGMIALWIAAHHGKAVGSVVAAGTSFGGPGAPEPEGGMAAMLDYLGSQKSAADITLLLPEGEKDPGYPTLVRHFMSLQYAQVPGFMEAPGSGYATAAGIIPPVPEARSVSPATRDKQAEAIRQFWSGPGLLPALKASKKRLLWISGTKDRIFPPPTASKAAAAVPGSWLVELEGVGHGIHLPDPLGFARHVTKFLDATAQEDKQQRPALEVSAPVGCFGGRFCCRR